MREMMLTFFVIAFFSLVQDVNSNVKILQHDALKTIKVGENISLTCNFSVSGTTTTVWLRQVPGEKPVNIATALYNTPVKYDTVLQETGRFHAFKSENTFVLNISKAEPSDSGTYYCVVTRFMDIDIDSYIVIVAGLHPHPVLHQHERVLLGDNITLQCSVLTKGCAGEHSVYWFRHGSGESHPGIIYTRGGSSDQCNKSSDTDSSTRSCVYNLPKNNLKTSDAGTYYCAVDVCGQILFSNRTNLDFKDRALDPALIVLVVSNIMSFFVILFLCMKLHRSYKKDAAEDHKKQINQTEIADALNYAALGFTQPINSRRTRAKINSEQSVYAQVVTQK